MKRKIKRRGRIPVIGDMLFSLMTLPLALNYVEGSFNEPGNAELFFLFIGTFFLMGVARLFRAFRYRGVSRVHFIKFLVYGCLMLAGCVSAAFFSEDTATRILLIVYWGSLIADRVFSIVTNHRLRNLVINLIVIFLLGWSLVEMYNSKDLLFFVMLVVVMHSLISILSVAFARINLKSLGKVIRETYAAEIMGGLLLVIFAFSYIFTTVEPNLNTLGDALWYCFAIVTTIGFGDITATTLVGRMLSVILGMYGIVVVALITSVIVNYYGEMKRENAQGGEELQKADSL